MVDVFASIDRGILVEDPYPHLVVENALPSEVADTLLAAMPPLHVFLQGREPGSNVRFALPSPQAFDHPGISDEWKGSAAGLRCGTAGVARSHAVSVRRLHPADLSGIRAPVRTHVRASRHASTCTGPTAARGPDGCPDGHQQPGLERRDQRARPPSRPARQAHLGPALLALCLGRPVGGELQLYAPATRKLTFDDTNLGSGDSVRVVRTYPYRHNLLVLPFCSPVAIHGVSPRGQTPIPRYHLHLVGEVAAPLFDVPRPTRAQQM